MVKRPMSLSTRRELTCLYRRQYQSADRARRRLLLEQCLAATGYHRKYALTLLNRPQADATRPATRAPKRRTRRRRYDAPVEAALVRLWESSRHLCSKRLVPFLPERIRTLERFGEIPLPEVACEKLRTLSAATCDRLLAPHRRTRGKSLTKPGTLLKAHVPVRPFADWQESQSPPGFCEIDLVAHCGESAAGEFAYTLTLTDIYSGWTQCRALANTGQVAVVAALETLRDELPFPLRGLDSDNGSEFLNAHRVRYRTAHQITYTRGRPGDKNDQGFVEQKNWSIVRQHVGYRRYEGASAVERLNRVYATLALVENYFQPTLKLSSKERSNGGEGGRVTKRYAVARTPYRRLVRWGADALPQESPERLQVLYATRNPVVLNRELTARQERLFALPLAPESPAR